MQLGAQTQRVSFGFSRGPGHAQRAVAENELLDNAALRAVDSCLEQGDLSEAQRRLAQLGAESYPAAAVSYLATRLLYLRNRLDPQSVAERMRDLLRQHPNFIEARRLLGAASGETTASTSEMAPVAASIPSRPTERGMPSVMPPAGPYLPSEPPTAKPTYRPPNWPPPELVGALERNETDRPTAVGTEDPSAHQIVVDTRGAHGSPVRSASLGVHSQRARPEGTYSISARNSVPPAPPPTPTPWRKPSDSQPIAAVSLGTGVYSQPDRRSPIARSPEDRLVLSVPPGAARHPRTIPPGQRPLQETLSTGELWPSVERQIRAGEHAEAIRYFEESARRQISHLPPLVPEREHEVLAQLGAELLNSSWITHQFAPFDLSLQSLSRLQLAIGTTYGRTPPEKPAPALLLLLGSYIGEALRMAHRGTWQTQTTASSALLSHVRAGAHEWQPYDLVRSWLQRGGNSLLDELGPSMARPGSVAWQSSAQIKVIPHVAWEGDVDRHSASGLGQALCSSVWCACCRLWNRRELDLSLESLASADWLFRILVDTAHPLRGDEPWLQRITLHFGSYAAEVYRAHAPASWLDKEAYPDAEPLALELPTGLVVSPIAYLTNCAVARRFGVIETWVRSLLASPDSAPI